MRTDEEGFEQSPDEPLITVINSPQWEDTLSRVIPSIVSIRSITPRSFDTESRRTSQATGFIVDSKRGIILSNRHVVQPGPILADAIFNKSKEEVKLIPIYRDPGIFDTNQCTISDFSSSMWSRSNT